MSTVYEELVKRDELVYAEKCSFMEALLILRYSHDRSSYCSLILMFLFLALKCTVFRNSAALCRAFFTKFTCYLQKCKGTINSRVMGHFHIMLRAEYAFSQIRYKLTNFIPISRMCVSI